VEQLASIRALEYRLRTLGAIVLADPKSRRVWFYAYKPNEAALRPLVQLIKGRTGEMVDFLVARASVRGETT
jgi:hypothetical protein